MAYANPILKGIIFDYFFPFGKNEDENLGKNTFTITKKEGIFECDPNMGCHPDTTYQTYLNRGNISVTPVRTHSWWIYFNVPLHSFNNSGFGLTTGTNPGQQIHVQLRLQNKDGVDGQAPGTTWAAVYIFDGGKRMDIPYKLQLKTWYHLVVDTTGNFYVNAQLIGKRTVPPVVTHPNMGNFSFGGYNNILDGYSSNHAITRNSILTPQQIQEIYNLGPKPWTDLSIIDGPDAPPEILATGISIDTTGGQISFEPGHPATVQLAATITPENTTNKEILWTSSDSTIFSVDDTGEVTRVIPNTTTMKRAIITAATTDGSNLTDQIVCVLVPITLAASIQLNKTDLILETGTTETLITTISPENVTEPSVNWTSSDETIATVDSNGTVTCIKEGLVLITAATVDGTNLTASCRLEIIVPPPKHDPRYLIRFSRDDTVTPGQKIDRVLTYDTKGNPKLVARSEFSGSEGGQLLQYKIMGDGHTTEWNFNHNTHSRWVLTQIYDKNNGTVALADWKIVSDDDIIMETTIPIPFGEEYVVVIFAGNQNTIT